MANVLMTAAMPGANEYYAVGKVVSVSSAVAAAMVAGGFGVVTEAAPTNIIPTSADELASLLALLPTTPPDVPGVLWNDGGVPCLSQ